VARDNAAAHRLAVPLALPHAVTPAALHACMESGAARFVTEASLMSAEICAISRPSALPAMVHVRPA